MKKKFSLPVTDEEQQALGYGEGLKKITQDLSKANLVIASLKEIDFQKLQNI